MEEVREKRKIHYGFFVLFSCCVMSATSISLAFGCSGIFYTPICESLGVSRGAFTLSVTIQGLVSGFGLKLVNPAIDRFGLKKTILGLLSIQAGCYFAMAHFTRLWMFYVTGAIMGLVLSLMTSLMNTVTLNKWFLSNAGTFVGFSASMAGVSGIILNPIAGAYMQAHGWQATYTLYGIIMVVFAIPVVLFLYKNEPADVGLEPYVSKKAKAKKGNEEMSYAGVRHEVAIHSKAFLYMLIYSLVQGGVTSFVPYIPSYASSIGMSLTFAASLAGTAQIGSLIGKNTIGIIADKKIRLLVILGPLIPAVGLLMMITIGRVSPMLMCVGAALFGIVYGSNTVGNTLIMMHMFGMRDYMKIYATMGIITAIPSSLFNSLWGFIADICKGDFTASVLICMMMCIAASVFGNLAFPASKKLPREVRKVTM